MSEDYFKKKYTKNPSNLFRKCNYCSRSQPRYRLHPDHQVAYPKFKYLAYKQCLPGCIVILSKPFNKSTFMTFDKSLNVLLTNDTSCVAYDKPSLQNPSSNFHAHSASKASSYSTLPPSNLPVNTGNFLKYFVY